MPGPGVERQVRVTDKQGKEARLWNREQKLVAPPTDGLTSIYCDGSISPKVSPRELAEEWLESADVALFKHPHRSCAYAEIDACVARQKISAKEAEQARGTLLLSGFPRDYGLWALGVIVRRVHANQIQRFAMPMVWEMTKHVTRDQLWFPFCLWKLRHSERRIRTIDADVFDNPFFSFKRHGT